MSSRTEEQRTILVAEWRVVEVHSDSVCAGFLFRKRNVEADSQLLFVFRLSFHNFLFEKVQMFV